MRDNDRLTFELLMQYNGEEMSQPYAVHPGYTRLTLGWSKEGDKVYYTKKIGGTLTFLGDEYELIQTQGLLCTFWVVIYDEGTELCRGTFRKTDCKTDRDHRVIEVELTADDIYNDLEGNNSEYNITKWGMEKHQMGVRVPPVVQLYPLGGEKIYTSTNGTSIEGDVVEPVSDVSELTNTYRFGVSRHVQVTLKQGTTGWGQDISADEAGNYIGIMYFNVNNNRFQGTLWKNGVYNSRRVVVKLEYEAATIVLVNASDSSIVDWVITLGAEAYKTASTVQIYKPEANDYEGWINGSGYSTNARAERQATVRFYLPCGRIALNKEIQGAYPMPEEDLYDEWHKYAWPRVTAVHLSLQLSETDNGYRQYEEGSWYAPPSGQWAGGLSPYQPERWTDGVSAWRENAYLTPGEIAAFSETGDIRDWYSLGDVIGGMLQQMDNSLIWEQDTAHSMFLFGATNPITGETQGQLYVTQKSNLLNYRYEYPAWNALLTWNRLETVLRDMFNCYYDIYIDGQGRKHFRIEHILFYENGLSYTPQERSVIDLTAIRDPRNRKPYSFMTDRWSYDKDRPYTRMEFSWMDKQSEPFDAFAVQVPKRYMIYTRNTIDHRDVDWFSSDIDFLLSVPGQASNDGFIIAMEEPGSVEQSRVVCQGDVRIGDVVYWCQNNRCALGYLQKAFLLYGLYSPYVTMDGDEETLVATPEEGRKKLRMQDVDFALPRGQVARPESLYKTETGEGLVETLEIDLTDMSVTATLRQPNEELL